MNRNRLFLVVWVMLLLLPGSARAGTMTLEFTDLDTGHSRSFTDDDNDGVIDTPFISVGNFDIVAATAISKPNLTNGPNESIFDLFLPSVTNVDLFPIVDGSATLRVRLTDTDFALADAGLPWSLTSQIGGLTDGTVAYQEIYDPDNSKFAETNSGNDTVNDFGVLGGLATPAASLSSGIATKANPFSLTEILTIEHSSQFQFTSLDSDSVVSAVPEPTSCLAWAVGAVVLLCGPRYRRRKSQANH